MDVLRIVIPCTSATPENKYWQARAMEEGVLRYESPHNVSRGDAICLVWAGVPKGGTALVEGPMDALAAAECGLLGIAMMGNSPPEAAVEYAKKFLVPPVLIVGDDDAVAEASVLWARFPGAFFVGTYPHKDLAAMPLKERKERLHV